ncbi:hypothetical protein VKT23_000373 [Stygiomarasmius scandens]|uniref:Cytochrome P450 n=1 Tax=Marasmiellus scandens TaxID=2682957 RepID=A0ABR1K551_9AGAR
MGELFQNQAGLTDFKWQQLYGDVIRFKASFNNDRMLIADPKALQHILQTSGYKWQKYTERKELSRLTGGRGILWADGNIEVKVINFFYQLIVYGSGDVHKRHRKVMLPGFGFPEAKNFIPLFSACAESMSVRWKDIISANGDQPVTIDIPEWTSRATLDAIGRAAFDYEFHAMENDDNELQRIYRNMMPAAFGSPSNGALIWLDIAQYIPAKVLEFIDDHVPSKRLAILRRSSEVTDRVAKELISMKSNDILEGKSNRDVMSLLIKANASQNPKIQLSDIEMISQMRYVFVAMSKNSRRMCGSFLTPGHETTSNTLTWTMLEMARHPDMQMKLRKEIRETEQKLRALGRTEFSAHDFESMPYLTAVVKETLRFHPVAIHLFRNAVEDDVLPLSNPITTTTGETITELSTPKGTRIVISLHAYNRNTEIFGEDAHIYNPERWLTPNYVKTGVSLGVYANLASFSAGVRSCIGWRFAVIELQVFIVEMIRNFEFAKTPKIDKLRREACLVMVPTIEGEVENGSQLPLKVSLASSDED